MSEDRELRRVVVKLLAAMVRLHDALNATAQQHPEIREPLHEAHRAIEDAVGELEEMTAYERSA